MSGCRQHRRQGAAEEFVARRRALLHPASPSRARATAGRRLRQLRTEPSRLRTEASQLRCLSMRRHQVHSCSTLPGGRSRLGRMDASKLGTLDVPAMPRHAMPQALLQL